MLILVVFYFLYHSANSAFADLSDRFWIEVGKFFQLDLPLERIGALMFALGVAGMILWERKGANHFRNSQKRKVKDVHRKRPERNTLSLKFNPISLKNEYKIGVILLVSLNIFKMPFVNDAIKYKEGQVKKGKYDIVSGGDTLELELDYQGKKYIKINHL